MGESDESIAADFDFCSKRWVEYGRGCSEGPGGCLVLEVLFFSAALGFLCVDE